MAICKTCGQDHDKPIEHNCIHGKVIGTFNHECSIGYGIQARPGYQGASKYKCPWRWYYKDCKKYKPNPNYVP